MSVMLYYPYVNPSETALHQAVLYWDKLATLIPAEPGDELLAPDLLRVRDAGLYDGIVPEKELQASWTFDRLALERALDELQRSAPAHELVPERAASFLYGRKVGREVIDLLVRRGLARKRSYRLIVPRSVVYVVVGTLARSIAEFRDHLDYLTPIAAPRTIPFTDHESAHQAAHVPGLPRDLNNDPNKQLAWEVELGAFLPLPQPGTDLGRLLDFRRRHDDERQRLMLALEMLVHGLQRNYEHPMDVYRMLNASLTEAVRDLEEAGKSMKISWMYRSTSVLIALGAAVAAEKFAPGTGWLLGTISGMAVNVATTQVRKTEHATAKFSYLARVHRELARDRVGAGD